MGNPLDRLYIIYLNDRFEEEFTPCQRRCATQNPDPWFIKQNPVKMVVWDILEADGVNVENRSYLDRKDILSEWFWDQADSPLPEEDLKETIIHQEETIIHQGYTEDLVAAWQNALAKNHEGLIIKDKASSYQHSRSFSWLKVKNWIFEKANVIGYTPGTNARAHFFGSLVLTDPETGAFKGCAGSGFDEVELRTWKDHFRNCPPMTKPFGEIQVGNPYTAVKTNKQVLVKYYQLTAAGSVMRFPIYILSSL